MARATLIFLLLALNGGVQSAHITDKLLAGFYQQPDTATEPGRLLTSGTPLEVLKQQGEMARVRLGDRSEGWIESRYISDEKPARVTLLEMQAKTDALQKELELLQKGGGSDADALLRKELKVTKQLLDDARKEVHELKAAGEQKKPPESNPEDRQRIQALQAELTGARESLQAQSRDKTSEQRIKGLEADNRQLRQRMVQAAKALGTEVPPLAEAGTILAAGYRFQLWHIALLALPLLAGFLAGVIFRNYRLRKKYSGLRL
jgi:SH3 domain protein